MGGEREIKRGDRAGWAGKKTVGLMGRGKVIALGNHIPIPHFGFEGFSCHFRGKPDGRVIGSAADKDYNDGAPAGRGITQ